MKAAQYGAILFGASAVLAGVVTLLWRDSDLWQRLHPLGLAATATIVWIFGLAQVIGGVALPFRKSARWAAILLGVVYALFAFICVPAMIVAPTDAGQYVNFFEQLSVACGAVAAYLMVGGDFRRVPLGRVTRVVYGVCVASYAWAQVVYFKYTASLVPTWIPPNQAFWTWLTTIAFALAAIAILINRQARLASNLLAIMIALFGLLVWVPHLVTAPKELSNWGEFAANYLMTATPLIIAQCDAVLSRIDITTPAGGTNAASIKSSL